MCELLQRGKESFCLFVSIIVLGLLFFPQVRYGETIFAYNLHNLGRAMDQVVQLQERQDSLPVPIGCERREYRLRV